MNLSPKLTSVHPPLASTLAPGLGGLAPATGPAHDARPASAWLDEGTQGYSEVLHVGPNSRPREIEDIVRDFKAALCLRGPDKTP